MELTSYKRERSRETFSIKYTVRSSNTVGREVGILRRQLSSSTINTSCFAFQNNYHRLSTGLKTFNRSGDDYNIFNPNFSRTTLSFSKNHFRRLQTRPSRRTQMPNIQETRILCTNSSTSSLAPMASDPKQILHGADDTHAKRPSKPLKEWCKNLS